MYKFHARNVNIMQCKHLPPKRRKSRDVWRDQREKKGIKEGIWMYYVHIPIPHRECTYYVPQTCTN